MADNRYNKVEFGDEVLLDVSDATLTSTGSAAEIAADKAKIIEDEIVYGADGKPITGTMPEILKIDVTPTEEEPVPGSLLIDFGSYPNRAPVTGFFMEGYSGVLRIPSPDTGHITEDETKIILDLEPFGDAKAEDVLVGKYYTGDGRFHESGTMRNNGDTSALLESRDQKIIIPEGYTSGGIIQLTESDKGYLVPGNIARGVTILGIPGTHEGGTDISDADAKLEDVLITKTFYSKESPNRQTGGMANLAHAVDMEILDSYDKDVAGHIHIPAPETGKITKNVTEFWVDMDDFGTATQADVRVTKKFTSTAGVKIEGQMANLSGGEPIQSTWRDGTSNILKIQPKNSGYCDTNVTRFDMFMEQNMGTQWSDATPGYIESGTLKTKPGSNGYVHRDYSTINVCPAYQLGNATQADVSPEKYFTSQDGVKIKGQMPTIQTVFAQKIESSDSGDTGTVYPNESGYCHKDQTRFKVYTEKNMDTQWDKAEIVSGSLKVPAGKNGYVTRDKSIISVCAAWQLGTATQADVAPGKSFTSQDGVKLDGHMPILEIEGTQWNNDKHDYVVRGGNFEVPAGTTGYVDRDSTTIRVCGAWQLGDAEQTDVAPGKTFTSQDGVKLDGAMPILEIEGTQWNNDKHDYVVRGGNFEVPAGTTGYVDRDQTTIRVCAAWQLGSASEGQVANGVTFTSENGVKLTGSGTLLTSMASRYPSKGLLMAPPSPSLEAINAELEELTDTLERAEALLVEYRERIAYLNNLKEGLE